MRKILRAILALALSALIGGTARAQVNRHLPYNVEATGINPLAADTVGKQFVLGYQVNLGLTLTAGYSYISPNSAYGLVAPSLQPLDIARGPDVAAGLRTQTIPGIATEAVAATKRNPGAAGYPNGRPNYTAAHMTIPIKKTNQQRGVLWNVLTPTLTGDSLAGFSNAVAADYLACDKFIISAALLGGEVVPDANAALCQTPDGHCLMATTMVANNGTRNAHLWIAVSQLQGGLTPSGLGQNWRNGNKARVLDVADAQCVNKIAWFDAPSNVRFDPSDWNGNIAICVTRNIGDVTASTDTSDKHEETLIVWLALYAKRGGVLLTHFRLGSDANGGLTAYKNNHAAALEFRRTDANVPGWISFGRRVPADAIPKYTGSTLSVANAYGVSLKTGMDGRAHLVYVDTGGRAFEEVYSWGDGGDSMVGRYVFYFPEYYYIPFLGQYIWTYRFQQLQYYDDSYFVLKFSPFVNQVAPIFYGMKTSYNPGALSNYGTQAGLTQVVLPITRLYLCANGSFLNGDDWFSRTTAPFTQGSDHAVIRRDPVDYQGPVKAVPIGFIEGPPPYPNENLTAAARPSMSDPGTFFATNYTVGTTDSVTQDFVTDTGVSANVKIGAKLIVGLSLDMNAAWKQSDALKTERTTVYDTRFFQTAGADTSTDSSVSPPKTNYKMRAVGQLLYRQVRAAFYRYYILDPSGNAVPGTDSLRLVLGNDGVAGVGALSSTTFDLDTSGATRTPVRPGNLSSYLSAPGEDDWNDLKGAALLDTTGAELITSTSGNKTDGGLVGITKTVQGESRTHSRSEDLSYLAGVNLSIPLIGFTAEFKSGESYSSKDTTIIGLNQNVSLTSSFEKWPPYTAVPGSTYGQIAYNTFLLAPSGRWLDELISHLKNRPTTKNTILLNQLMPGSGVFKITYRINRGNSLNYLRD